MTHNKIHGIWVMLLTMILSIEGTTPTSTTTETLPTGTSTATLPTGTETSSLTFSETESSSSSKSETETETSSNTFTTSATDSISSTATESVSNTFSETLPTSTITSSYTLSKSETSTVSIAVLLGVITVSEPIGNIFINPNNDPALQVDVHLSVFETEYDYSGITVTPVCSKGSFFPSSIEITPPAQSDLNFKFTGTEVGTTSIHWLVTPLNNTLNDASATRFKRISSTPITVRGLFSWSYESEAFYAFEKGEYIGVQSPGFPLTLTEAPLSNVTVRIEGEGGLTFTTERKTLEYGDLSFDVSVKCSVTGNFEIVVVLEQTLNGDLISLYEQPPSWNHTCLPTVVTELGYNGLPPFEDNDSEYLVLSPGQHRDYQNYDLRLSCESSPEGLTFSPVNFTVTGPAGGRITCSGPAGIYNISCWRVDWVLDGVHYGEDKLAFYDPEPIVGFEVLDKNTIETPFIPVLRMLQPVQSSYFTDGGAFSPGLSLVLSQPPRSRLEVTVTDSLGVLETNPSILVFSPHSDSVSFRIRAHRTTGNEITSLKYTLGGDNKNDYVIPGDVAVQVQGPSERCVGQPDSDSCYGLWEYEMCWWNFDTNNCENTLIPIALSPQPPPSQYHQQSIPYEATVAAPPVFDLRLSFGAPEGGLEFQDKSVIWSGDRTNTTQDSSDTVRYFSITGTKTALNEEPTETFIASYILGGTDFHHYKRPEPNEVVIMELISMLPPTTQQYPFLYVNTVSKTLSISLQKPPPVGMLVLTPTCLNPNCGLTFEPSQIVFSSGVSQGSFRVKTSLKQGEFWVTMVKSGAAATLYKNNNITNALIKVFPTIEIHTTPLPTLGDEEWSSPMFVELQRAPIETITILVTAVSHIDFSTPLDNSLVQLVAGDTPPDGIDGTSSLELHFSPKQRTLSYRFRGMTPGTYGLLFSIGAGTDAQNFLLYDDKRMRTFVVAPPKAWEFTRGQFGVDPECRVAVGRLDSNSLSITAASKETCSISDVLDPSQLCHQTTKKSCENELRNNGRPCIWLPSTSTCKYGLPSGNITHYSIGEVHSLFRMFDGSLWSAGSNEFGQLGHSCHGAGGCLDSITYKEVFFENRTDKGTCRQWETSQQDVCQLIKSSELRRDNGDLEYVVSVATGSAHTMVKMSSGIVYAWGSNNFGQLGVHTLQQMIPVPTKVPIPERSMERVTCIAVGAYHSVAISDYGKVYVWGWNYYGQIAHEQSYRNSLKEPVMIHELVSSWALDKPISISAGDYHTVIGTKSGAVFTWGRNNYGQLARQAFDDLNPTLVELYHPAVFHGGMCAPDLKIPPSWPPGTDFTLGLKDYSIYERT